MMKMMMSELGEYVLIRRITSGELYVTSSATYKMHSVKFIRPYYSGWEVLADSDNKELLETMRDLAREANNVR